MSEANTIYTIGHSNVRSSKIVHILKQYNIQVLIDVRSSPYSQYSPEFNRESFEVCLRDSLIDYKFAGEYLGGRPKDPSCYRNGKVPDSKADFLHLVDYPAVMTKSWFIRGLNRLIQIAESQRVVIMCSEEDPSTCHRHHLIGKALIQRGINVMHIRNDGNMVKAKQIPDLKFEPPVDQPDLF